ncbi:unnamed protein product [Prunus brigantina]
MLRMLLMAVKLRSRRPQTLKELRKMLMEMKIVSLILCCRLGEAVCQGKPIKPDEKCSGMIRMGISLLRCWNSNQAMLVILMMKMQILAYVLLCRYHSVHELSGYICWIN